MTPRRTRSRPPSQSTRTSRRGQPGTALPITISNDPLTCVVRGAGKLLDTLDRSGGWRFPRRSRAIASATFRYASAGRGAATRRRDSQERLGQWCRQAWARTAGATIMNVTQAVTGAPTTRPRTTPAASAPTAIIIMDHAHPDGHERGGGLRRISGENENPRVDRRDTGVMSCG